MEKFKLWLQNLPQKVYRVKGFITFENSPNKYLVQISNSNVLIEKYDIDIDDYLILIGEKIDEENIFLVYIEEESTHKNTFVEIHIM